MNIIQELPFEEIKKTDIAGRADIRKHEDVKLSRETYKIKTSSILYREKFNPRTEYNGIEELAELILANGIITPLTVDILKDGRIYVERGHRRLKALQLLISKGHDFESVECFVNNTNTTEFERIKAIYTSNHVSPLTPTENAVIVARLKANYGMTHDQISKELGLSRQSVDNYAKIAEMPEEVKDAISDKKVSVNDALKISRKIKSEPDQGAAFQTELEKKYDRKQKRLEKMDEGLVYDENLKRTRPKPEADDPDNIVKREDNTKTSKRTELEEDLAGEPVKVQRASMIKEKIEAIEAPDGTPEFNLGYAAAIKFVLSLF